MSSSLLMADLATERTVSGYLSLPMIERIAPAARASPMFPSTSRQFCCWILSFEASARISGMTTTGPSFCRPRIAEERFSIDSRSPR